jgi:Flp pilus assembly protein, ATPase CpaF
MELHERLTQSGTTLSGIDGGGTDPFADLKNRIHLGLVSELGPGLFDVSDTDAVRARVEAEIRTQLQQEAGLSRDDRERLASEIADDVFGYGPLERLLPDSTISEIMVNGAHEIWIERRGLLSRTSLRFSDESHLRRIITKMVGQVGRRIDESSPMVDARLPDGSRINAIIAPLSLSGALLTIRKFDQGRFALDELIQIGTLTPRRPISWTAASRPT